MVFFLYQSQRASPLKQGAAQTEGDVVSVYFPGEGGKLQRKVVEVHKQPSDKARAETLFRELKEARSVPDRLKIYEMALGSDGVLILGHIGGVYRPEYAGKRDHHDIRHRKLLHRELP